MMSDKDVRWQQRFSNYGKALAKLDEAVKTIKEDYADANGHIENDFLDDMLKEALIQRFEYTHELAWNVMKDYLFEVAGLNTMGSKDATREAFSSGLITEGEVWMEMIKSRNMTSHTYNESTANEIYSKIMNNYHPAFLKFRDDMEKRHGEK